MKEYYLFLITDDRNDSNYLSNKHFVYNDTLEEIDKFTMVYQDAQDLGNDINVYHVKKTFVDAVIVSKSNLFYMLNHGDAFPKKEEKVLFAKDKDFVLQKKDNAFYDEVLIDEYKNFLLNHKKEICHSLVKYVKLGVDIDESILDENLDQAFYSYYKRKTYKKLRDTYFDLKRKEKKYKRVR